MRPGKKVFVIAAVILAFVALNVIFGFLKTENARLSGVSCILNLQRVGAALSQYVSKHNSEVFPDSLEVLAKENLISRDDLKCPASGADYKYLPGVTLDAPSFLFLVWCEDEHDLNIGKGKPVFARMALLADLSDVRPYEPAYLLVAARKYSEIASLSGEDGASRLLEIINNERDLHVRALAIWKLSALRRPELLETFATYLTVPVPDLQFESARALAQIGDKRAAGVLVKELRSNSYLKRRQAFLSLQALSNGKTFGYNPLLPDKAQSEPLRQWQIWLASLRK
jgi:hypothetical protein